MNRHLLGLLGAVWLVGIGLISCDRTPSVDANQGSRQVDAPAQPSAPVPTEPPEKLVSTERLMGLISKLPTKRAALGDQAHVDGLHETQKLLIGELHAMGLEPTLQRLTYEGGLHTPDRPLYNIIVDLPGRANDDAESSFADEVVVFSAHFDAVPGAPGADDDGTGVAAILEMARLLKDRPMKRTLRLVLFNLEEVGIIGSLQYAHALREAMQAQEHTELWRGERLVGMVSMDMLGYYRDEPGSQQLPANIPQWVWGKTTRPTIGDFIATATVLKYRPFSQALKAAMHEAEPLCKVFAFDVLPIAPPDLMRSDHAPFWAIDVPAIIMSDTAELRSPHYHTPSDTIETIDRERYTQTVRAVVGAAWRLCGPAEQDDTPDWMTQKALVEPKTR